MINYLLYSREKIENSEYSEFCGNYILEKGLARRRIYGYDRIKIKEKPVEATMTREQVFETLNEVFQDVFDDMSIEVDEHTTSDDIDEWDSLEHINLIASVEQEFGVKFNMGQVNTMKNVGEMVDIILSQID